MRSWVRTDEHDCPNCGVELDAYIAYYPDEPETDARECRGCGQIFPVWDGRSPARDQILFIFPDAKDIIVGELGRGAHCYHPCPKCATRSLVTSCSDVEMVWLHCDNCDRTLQYVDGKLQDAHVDVLIKTLRTRMGR